MMRFVALLSYCSLAQSAFAAQAEGEPPNIVVILADDLGYGDPRCANPDSKIPTPNLDRLAREGVRLTDAHSPSAVCTPTRYGLLTGRYCWRTRLKQGVLDGASPALIDPGRATLATVLRSAGYRTACIGKWHLGFGDVSPVDYSAPLRPGPLDFGFDHFFGISASLDMAPYVFIEGDRPESPASEHIARSEPRRNGGSGFWRAGAVAPGFTHEGALPRVVDEAISWIEARARADERFFLYLPLPAPHTPWMPTAEFRGKSQAGPYGDFVTQVDDSIGRVLGVLDEHELGEDTLVIVTSDNGAHWQNSDIEEWGHRANGALRGQKADIHEGGHRVPFFARWPGEIPAESVRDDLVSLLDLYATFAGMVGHELEHGEGEDSFDVMGVLRGAQFDEPPRVSLVHHSFRGAFALRSGNWKLIETLGSGGFTKPVVETPTEGGPTGQLYDLWRDPGEQNNLWSEEPEVLRHLQDQLDRIRTRGRSRERAPNIVIVFTDDQGFADVGVYGADKIKTPNIDRIASEGVRFTDFHVAQPVCSASRAALLTGCYPNRIGISGALMPNAKHGIHDDETTLAELCKSRGYATAIFGKWHLGHHAQFNPLNHGFDEFYGIPYSNDMWPGHPQNPKAWGDLPTMDGFEAVGYNTDQDRFTGDITARAVDFIERNADKPFFLYVPHPMPHVPLHASAEFRGRSEQGLYGDVIEEIDASVGSILAALERTGVAEDTFFVFTSDNGPWLSYGNHAGSTGPLREGKGTNFEGGVRVPCVARFPGRIPAGHVCTEPLMTIDVLPTVAHLIDAELPPLEIDGRNGWPLFAGEPGARSQHEAYFFYYKKNHLEAVRSGRWKLHLPHGYRSMNGRKLGADGLPGKYDYSVKTGLELYDLDADIGESHDVAERYPEVVERLSGLAEEMRSRLGDLATGREGSENREPGRLR